MYFRQRLLSTHWQPRGVALVHARRAAGDSLAQRQPVVRLQHRRQHQALPMPPAAAAENLKGQAIRALFCLEHRPIALHRSDHLNSQ
jgi:hypothetical protein